MKFLIITDVVLENFIYRENISQNISDIVFNYNEEIITALLNIEKTTKFQEFDIILIHSDQIFHNKGINWLGVFYEEVYKFSIKYKDKKILLSNLWIDRLFSEGVIKNLGILLNLSVTFYNQLSKLKELDNLIILDLQKHLFQYGENNLYNYSLGFLYQMPYTKQMTNLILNELNEILKYLYEEEKKVILIDCDNTLWKGIIGEDGIDNIYCDKTYKGIVFYKFQQFLLKKKEEGFLLALVSKNNEIDVKNAFEKKNMPLKWDDFIIKKINWNEKYKSIMEISSELNMFPDSFIFIDDNQFEIDSVKNFTGINNVVLFKDDIDFLFSVFDFYFFKKKRILQSDLEKTAQYITEDLRTKAKNKFANFEDFLLFLDIKIDIRKNDFTDFERLSQLTEKTNQFNFNKNFFSVTDLHNWIEKGNIIFSFKVSDIYGDYGTIGLMLIEIESKRFNIYNYIISCRALGKNIEHKIFTNIINIMNKDNLSLNKILFKETQKNLPAKLFIEEVQYERFIERIK